MAKTEDENLVTRLKDDMKASLTVSEVFERYYYPLRKIRADLYTAICPYHSDKNDGNFHISNSKNIYKCFGCGESGDIISLVKNRFDCNFVDAVYILARDYGYISEADFDKRNVNFDENYEIIKKEKLAKKMEKIESIEAELASQDIIEKVYTIFSDLSPLSKSDYEYLKTTRGLGDERIKATYFTMPYCTQGFMRKLGNKLREIGLTEEDLIGVPGFYFDEEKGKIAFIGAKGIGIKVKNYDGRINRIQIRLTKPKIDKKTGKQLRYSWFSSAKKNLGCGSGSPVDISYPNIAYEDMKAVAFITEGKFKSEKINQVFDSVSISVQGITSWKDKILPEIKGISEKVNLKGVFLCYDADMSVNPQVYHQCKLMVENELGDYFPSEKIFMVTWDASLGKGIDDLIDNGNKNAVKKIPFTKYVEIFDKFLSEYEKNDKNEIINSKTKEVMDKDSLYEDYMKKVFPHI